MKHKCAIFAAIMVGFLMANCWPRVISASPQQTSYPLTDTEFAHYSRLLKPSSQKHERASLEDGDKNIINAPCVLPKALSDVLANINDSERWEQVLPYVMGAILGGSAAYSIAEVWGSDGAVDYFVTHGGINNAMPIIVSLILPEFLACTEYTKRFIRRPHHQTNLLQPPSKVANRLEWANRFLCSAFAVKYFKIYYAAFFREELSHAGGDYWFCLTYVASNVFKLHDVFAHKSHLIEHRFFHAHDEVHHLRHHLSTGLANTYRAFYKLPREKKLGVMGVLSLLQQTLPPDESHLRQLYYLLQLGRTNGQKEDLPFGGRAVDQVVKLFSLTLMPWAFLGGFFTATDIQSLIGLISGDAEDPETYRNPHNVASWIYGLFTAGYAGLSGYLSIESWTKFYHRVVDTDPNLYRDDLEFFPKSMGGLRSLTDVASYGLATLLMIPVAGLAASQTGIWGAPMSYGRLCIAWSAVWAMIMHNGFLGPLCQRIVGAADHFLDPTGRRVDEMMKDIIHKQKIINQLTPSALHTLLQALLQVEKDLATSETSTGDGAGRSDGDSQDSHSHDGSSQDGGYGESNGSDTSQLSEGETETQDRPVLNLNPDGTATHITETSIDAALDRGHGAVQASDTQTPDDEGAEGVEDKSTEDARIEDVRDDAVISIPLEHPIPPATEEETFLTFPTPALITTAPQLQALLDQYGPEHQENQAQDASLLMDADPLTERLLPTSDDMAFEGANAIDFEAEGDIDNAPSAHSSHTTQSSFTAHVGRTLTSGLGHARDWLFGPTPTQIEESFLGMLEMMTNARKRFKESRTERAFRAYLQEHRRHYGEASMAR